MKSDSAPFDCGTRPSPSPRSLTIGRRHITSVIHGHIHNNTHEDFWPLLAARDRVLNAGVEVNGYRPVTLKELIENNRRFKAEHGVPRRE